MMTHLGSSPVCQRDIAFQVSLLRSKEGARRREARICLTQWGRTAVPALIECLHDDDETVRWEAARTLRDIPDPSAAEDLVNTLPDPVPEIRWLAAEALIELGESAFKPLLRGLLEHFDSPDFRTSAHHILACFEPEEGSRQSFELLLDSFRMSRPEEEIPLAAYEALGRLYGHTDVVHRKEPTRKA